MSRRPRSAKTSVANSFSCGEIQFSGPVSDVGQEKQDQLWKQRAFKRKYCHTQTKHESEVESHHARLFSRCCWWAVPKTLSMPTVNWPCNRIKAEQQHMVFPNRHSCLFSGEMELGVVVLPEGVHFGQHRGGGANLEIFLLPCALWGYFLQKKETGDEVRNILGADQLVYLGFFNVFRCRESTGHSFAAMKQIGNRRHFQVSLTDFDRTACSFRYASSGLL